jgi:hypothetical protein
MNGDVWKCMWNKMASNSYSFRNNKLKINNEMPLFNIILKVKESYPCNRPWRPIGL